MFIDFESKKIKTAFRYFGYFIMTIMTIITTVVLIYLAKGYRFDRQTGHVVKDGLMLIDSGPVSATTTINSKIYSSTPGRYTLRAGDYKVNLSQKGYRNWQKNINITGSKVEWIYYPRLIPTNIETVPAFSVKNPEIISASQDDKTLFVRTKNDSSKLGLAYPLSAINKPRTIAWPTKKVITKGKNIGKFSVAEWALDNKHVMLKHVLGSKTEYLNVDTTKPNAVTNLTATIGKKIKQPHFRGGSSSQIYTIIKDKTGNNNLYLYNLKSLKTKPALLLKNVQKYVPYGNDMVLFAVKKGDKSQAGILNKGHKNVVKTHNYKAEQKFVLGYREYSGDKYFVIGSSDQPQANIYKNPLDNNKKFKPFAVLAIQSPHQIDFSTNSQFVSVQDGNHFAVFDFDADRSYAYDSSLNLNKTQVAQWMDSGHLLVNKNGKVYMWDFDNTNLQLLGQSKPKFNVVFANDYAQMWTVGKSSVNTKAEVMVSSLLANKNPQTFLPTN